MQKAVGLSGALGSRYRPINAATDEITRALEQKRYGDAASAVTSGIPESHSRKCKLRIDLSEQEAFRRVFCGDAEDDFASLHCLASEEQQSNREGLKLDVVGAAEATAAALIGTGKTKKNEEDWVSQVETLGKMISEAADICDQVLDSSTKAQSRILVQIRDHAAC